MACRSPRTNGVAHYRMNLLMKETERNSHTENVTSSGHGLANMIEAQRLRG